MCNLYRTRPSAAEVALWFAARDAAGNHPWPTDVYPDRMAPIVRHGADGFEIAQARWGMPTPPQYLKTSRDPGVTNVRNVGSPHWRRWLGPESRCLVPLEAFSEPGADRRPVWFELVDGGPAFFAGIQVRDWSSVRKVKDGPTVDDLFAFLTTSPSAEVAAIHPKAMPVILTREQEWRDWMTLAWHDVRRLQRPLPDGALRLVA